jgi:hypothetical protein
MARYSPSITRPISPWFVPLPLAHAATESTELVELLVVLDLLAARVTVEDDGLVKDELAPVGVVPPYSSRFRERGGATEELAEGFKGLL